MKADAAETIWVCPGEGKGRGTFEDPFHSLDRAIELLNPGQTVVLKSGDYAGDFTLQRSGTLEHPIYITSDERRQARFVGSAWFLYDVSDLVLTNLDFVDSPRSVISVIGACERNRFAHLRFTGCGKDGETSCGIFFGGSGAACNLVEDCTFERTALPAAGTGACVGAMVADGEEDGRIRDHIFRRNRFVNYSIGILVGSRDRSAGENGHIVECNTIDRCSVDGIVVKCGDTTLRNNTVRNCQRSGLSIVQGMGSIAEDNRILDCATGISVAGDGHTVRNNCIVRCARNAVHVTARSEAGPEAKPAATTNILIEANTCVGCGSDPAPVAGVLVEEETTCIIRRNLFHGTGAPYHVNGDAGARRAGRFISDNIASGGCSAGPGAQEGTVQFADRDRNDYGNDSGFGAQGWVLRSDAWEPAAVDEEEAHEYGTALEEEAADAAEALIDEVNEEEVARRALLLGEDEEES